MATRKDQLDAFVFARRRMVANLVVPTPTGSDEGAPRPVKTFFTSAILSAIAVAGVAVLGVFKPSAPGGWQSGLAVDSSSGAAYVYSPQDKQLHPVVNITSARLVLGSKFKKFDVPDSVINGPGITIGAPLGILNAPPDVPAAGNVNLTQWTMCLQSKKASDPTVSGGRTYLGIGYGPGASTTVAPPHAALFVHDDSGTNYMVSGDYAYPIDDNRVINPLTSTAVGDHDSVGPWVSSTWLKAFTPGTSLKFPTVADVGKSLPSGFPDADGRVKHIGDYGQVIGSSGPQYYIETDDGLVEVSQFVYTLYKANPAITDAGATQVNFISSDPAALNPRNEQTTSTSLQEAGTNWPQSAVLAIDISPFSVFCAAFSGSFDGNPAKLDIYYATALPWAASAGPGVEQASGPGYADFVQVLPGHGVLAREVSGGDSQTGPIDLVTDTGARYPMAPTETVTGLDDKTSQTSAQKQLQYDNVQVERIPDNWIQLLRRLGTLDPNNAGQPATVD